MKPNIDILPTVRDIIGLPKNKSDERIRLVQLIEKRPEDLKKRALFSYLWKKRIKNHVEWHSTIYKNWHFAKRVNSFEKLFLLLFDKKEQNNLIQKNKKIAILLKKKFEKFLKICRKHESIQKKLS